ncbi:MAG: DUF5686 family protein [Bacteroidia bacterium]
MTRFLLISILACCSYLAQAQEFYTLRGYVTGTDAEPLVGVYVRVTNLGVGTVTNEKGQYELNLPEGLNRVSYTFIGYESQRLDLIIRPGITQNIRLKVSRNELAVVEINNKRKDLSYDIIKKVIAQKEKYSNQYSTQKRSIYVKSVENNVYQKKEKTTKESKEVQEDESLLEEKKDSLPNLNLFEGDFVQHKKAPKGFKEEKNAAKKLGRQRTLLYTSTTDADFDFNQNLLYVKKLGDNSYISPISTTALLAYKYKLLGSRFENGIKVYTIKVIPRKMGNALFKGELEVWDSLFTLKSIHLEVNKNSLILYDKFSIHQEYQFVQGKHVLEHEKFTWLVKDKNGKSDGTCDVIYTNYVFDSTYSKRFFNAEIGYTKEDAYEKDTSFWAGIRPIPLTPKEFKFINYQDSIHRIRTSKVYLDSIDSVYNRITLLKALWHGFGRINRDKKTLLTFDPAIGLLDPVAIGGWRIRYSVSYFKRYENRKAVRISPFVNYGFRNRDIKGNLGLWHLYNPKKRSTVSLNTGKYFGFVNNFATFTDVFNRSNYFDEQYIAASHRTELFNGFYTGIGLRHTIRQDLGDFKFNPRFDSTFENNFAQTFAKNSATILSLNISFTPKQLYIQEPKEKIILGSRFPTFSLGYRQGLNGFLDSKSKFSTLDFSINQKFNVGILGQSQYSVNVGGFIDTASVQIMDYRYQRGGDPYFLIPPMFGYQLIDSTFATFKTVLETHYAHQFNGFITSKIPGIKQLGIRSMIGAGFLYVPEKQYQYSEMLLGINRIFKIGRERIKFGVYYVVGQSNTQGFTNGIKFSLNPYNADTSSWSF